MNYTNVVLAFSTAAQADGAAVNLLVQARTEEGFNADAFMVEVDAMLMVLVFDGLLKDNTAKTKRSMINKLAQCPVDALIDAAAQAAGLSAVYKLVCNSTAKTSNAGRKKVATAVATAEAAQAAQAAAATLEMVSLMDVLMTMQNIRNNVLPKMTSDMGLLEDCDAFMATLRAKVGAGKTTK
jgi:hypothetical protein